MAEHPVLRSGDVSSTLTDGIRCSLLLFLFVAHQQHWTLHGIQTHKNTTTWQCFLVLFLFMCLCLSGFGCRGALQRRRGTQPTVVVGWGHLARPGLNCASADPSLSVCVVGFMFNVKPKKKWNQKKNAARKKLWWEWYSTAELLACFICFLIIFFSVLLLILPLNYR